MTTLPEQRKQRVILLSRADAERVRGVSSPGHALDPRQIGEDQFILGPTVLEDPGHAVHIPFLSTLPHCDILMQNPGDTHGMQIITIVPGSIFKPDNTPRIYRPTGNPWDVPPFPEKGDWSESALHESVGRALSAWESFERMLAMLFAAFLSPTLFGLPAQRAYGSVITFRGRANMVEAAGEAYFLAEPHTDHQAALKSILKLGDKFSARRNEIAHGIVGEYSSPAGHVRGLALLPPEHATNKRNLRTDINVKVAWAAKLTAPRYAYTSVEIGFFAEKFKELEKPASDLINQIYRYFVDKDQQPSQQ
jgi:hypothetical protein